VKHGCVLPWLGKEIRADGKVSICCVSQFVLRDTNHNPIHFQDLASLTAADQNGGLAELKKTFLEGARPAACQSCWKLEDSGIVSRRQKMNRQFSAELERIANAGTVEGNVAVFDFKIGNICNQKCLICGPASSSLWIKEHSAVYDSSGHFKSRNLSKLTTPLLRDYVRGAQEIHISGGETFLAEGELTRLLAESIDSGASRSQHLILVTNGSRFPAKMIESVFPHFSKVQIFMSADGVGKQFEYSRHPGRWADFFANYLAIRTTPYFGGIAITLSALNAHSLAEDLLFWEKNNEPRVLINHLTAPAELAMENLPKKVLLAIRSRWIKAQFTTSHSELLLFDALKNLQAAIENQSAPSDSNFLEFIGRHDDYRKLSFKDAFTEYHSLF